MFKRIERRFIKLEDRISEQRDEINSLHLELEAYRDHGIIFGQMYKHKEGGAIFKMDCDMYRRLLYSAASFDDFDKVTYKPVVDDEDITTSIELDTTDADEEIARLNKELIQTRADLILEQSKTIKGLMHEALGNAAKQPMNIVMLVDDDEQSDYHNDGIKLMTVSQVLDGECDGMKIDDYVMSSTVINRLRSEGFIRVNEVLQNAMMTSNRRL
ncbi:hypothetical protein [Weissella paramesenteroides]|uniref:hypothetical protein n=1 Tax=Weissella paramesenteroides TaxID=1249 RepID=UPI003D361A23